MNDPLEQLHADLRNLHERLRTETLESYGRMNPFAEDLFDWKERGRAWTGGDSSVTIYNSATLIGDVTIGPDTWIGPFCMLDGSGGLAIGRNCSISAGCQLLTHDTARWALSDGKADYEYASTQIGDCCFLGVHSVVTRGNMVGDHCLVAAGAVVTTDVPDYSIVAGVPARPVGRVSVDAEGNIALDYEHGS